MAQSCAASRALTRKATVAVAFRSFQRSDGCCGFLLEGDQVRPRQRDGFVLQGLVREVRVA